MQVKEISIIPFLSENEISLDRDLFKSLTVSYRDYGHLFKDSLFFKLSSNFPNTITFVYYKGVYNESNVEYKLTYKKQDYDSYSSEYKQTKIEKQLTKKI